MHTAIAAIKSRIADLGERMRETSDHWVSIYNHRREGLEIALQLLETPPVPIMVIFSEYAPAAIAARRLPAVRVSQRGDPSTWVVYFPSLQAAWDAFRPHREEVEIGSLKIIEVVALEP